MRLSRRDKIARMLLIWAALAAVALVLVGCIRVVGDALVWRSRSWASRWSGHRAGRQTRK